VTEGGAEIAELRNLIEEKSLFEEIRGKDSLLLTEVLFLPSEFQRKSRFISFLTSLATRERERGREREMGERKCGKSRAF